MNLQYEKIYKIYEKFPWYLKDDVLGFGQTFFINSWSEKFNNELTEIFKKQFPKRKKINLTLLDDSVIELVRKEYQTKLFNDYESKLKHIKIFRELLNGIAENTEIIPTTELNRIKTSSASTYSSQGWGANKYARKSLDEDLEMLQKLGYQCEIRQKLAYDDPKCTWYDYELWCNITDWQFDCINRREKLDILQWSINCWKRGVNPKVYNPFLSNEIYDKSLEMRNE
jgi:hypothetical protein